MAPDLSLGPFQLLEPLASGGMSEVWKAFHPASGVKAAIKVIPPHLVSDPHARESLEKEIRTAAGLDHPGIVWVYDQGTIDEQTSVRSERRLLAGSPYLVLEYCSFSLSHMLPLRTWSATRTVVAGLLDALAHAHARGVVHRDLKPANVLVAGPDDLRPGLKLTDFGIAHALDQVDPETGRRIIGTPRYMAPEQIDGGAASLGAWTDLYALGCLVFRAVTGHGPFQDKGPKLLLAHLRKPPPPIDLPTGFPREFRDWVAWLLEKEPGRRPSSAAAAMEALPDGPLAALHPTELDDDPPTRPLHAPPTVTLTLTGLRGQGEKRGAKPNILDVPPTWRRPLPTHSPRLHDAGRALFGLRPVPIAGREKERDALWATLRQVSNRKQPAIVTLSGHPGLGRTRLLMWLTQRALELGCALDLAAWCDPGLPPATVARGMLERALRVAGTDDERRTRRIRDLHTRLDIRQGPLLLHALRPDADVHTVYAATRQLAGEVVPLGALLVTIDDVHHAPGILELARALASLEGPVMIVLTTTEEALGTDPEFRRQIEDLSDWVHELQPLEGAACSALVRSILPMSPSLAARVEERTAGNPRFAVQLVQDWVERDLLVAGPDGFDAPPDLPLPASIQTVWSVRLATLMAGLGDRAAECLELAAVLGSNVVLDDLRALRPDDEPYWQAISTRLLLKRFAVPTSDGFAFAHAALREALIQRAEHAGRLAAHHAACAALLAASDAPRDLARRGRHRAAAGDRSGAFEDLFRAAHHARTHVGIGPALVYVDEAEELVDDDDPRKARLMAFRARVLNTSRNFEAARGEAERAEALARRNGWRAEAAMARLQLAVCAYYRSEYKASIELCEEVIDELEPDGDPTTLGLAHSYIGWSQVMLGRLEKGLPYWDTAARHHRREPGVEGQIMALMDLADKASMVGDTAEIRKHLDAAWEIASDPPQLMRQIWLLERRVNLAFAEKDYEGARDLCEGMLDTVAAVSAGKTSRLRTLLGYTYVCLAEKELAHRQFLRCLHPDALPEGVLERAVVYAGLLASAPGPGVSAEIEGWLRQVEGLLQQSNARHVELGQLLRYARDNLKDPDLEPRLVRLMQHQPVE
ncbi:MAG: protein kinase [Alphaproteobacteria bacterium]|nr:protein kinase [Alphaproteobacteria bacterium]